MKFACYACSAVYLDRFQCCSVCFEVGTIIPVPEREKVIFERADRHGCKSIGDLKKIHRNGEFIEGFEALGKLPNNFKMLVYGLPGSGKSTFALLFLNSYRGKSIYAAIEEGIISESFLTKLETWEITSKDIFFSDCKTLHELKLDLVGKNISLVVVDSITQLGEIPNFCCSQIWIAHSTKDGGYKGDSGIGHLVDIVARCDKGALYVEKNRFAKLAKITIFEEREDAKVDLPVLF